jgi:gentisate 1,2-dioxygenase
MNTATLYSAVATNAEREEFYQKLELASAQPLWRMLGEVVTPEPRPASTPVLWSYEKMRPLLMEAGRLIGTQEAKRRVLVLENPGLRDNRITSSLLAGLQLVLPGEIAPAHRHVASALRLIVEGTGAYTSVSGERATMHPGDFIVTPSWTFHDHGNFSEDPVVWLDVLDIPTVSFFDASFGEVYSTDEYPVLINEGDSLARYGENLVPLEYKADSHSTPMFTYAYSRSREAVERLSRNGPPHPCHGIKMQYVNPVSGGYPMPTIAAFLQKLPAGFDGEPYRATDSTVYTVLEGQGRSRIGGDTMEWRQHDVFVVPSWYPVSHFAQKDSILFSISDRAAQKALGIWREEILHRN